MSNLMRFKPLAALLGAVVIAGGVAYFSPDYMNPSQKWLEFAALLFCYLFFEYHLPVQTPVPAGAVPVQGGAAPVQRPVPAGAAPVQTPVQRVVQPAVQVVAQPDPPREALKLTFYQREAVVINRQLAEVYKLPLAIDFRDPNAIVMTPTKVVYRTKQLGPVAFAKVERIAVDLARDINTLYRQKSLAREKWHQVKVSVVDAQPIVFQVTRVEPKMQAWETRPSLAPFQTCVGFYLKGWDMEPQILDIANKDSQHGFGIWIGQQRSGKSRSMEAALNQLLANTPSGLELYGIDLNGALFDNYKGVPQFKGGAKTMEEALPILAMFAKWCDAQYAPDDGVVRLLVIDEFHKLLAAEQYREEALRYIKKIMQEGGKYLLRIWAATQNPNEENYPALIKPLTQFTLCSRIQNDLYVRNILQIFGASDLLPKVEQLYTGPEGVLTLATFWYSDADVKASLAELRKLPVQVVPAAVQVVQAATPVDPAAPAFVAPGEVAFPIKTKRPLTSVEADEVVRHIEAGEFLYREKLSLTRVCKFAYGSKNEDKLKFVKDMLKERGISYEE